MRTQLIVSLTCLVLALLPSAGAAEKKAAKAGLDPHPVSKTFYIAGVSSEAQAAAITAAISSLPSVTAVKELTPTSGYVRVAFDTHKIASHLIAHKIMELGAYTVTLKFDLPDYAKNAEKLDALFARLLAQRQVKIEATDKEKGRFVLTYLPITPDASDPRKVGFNFGHLGHPIQDPAPAGMGLKLTFIEAPSADGAATKGKRKAKQ